MFKRINDAFKYTLIMYHISKVACINIRDIKFDGIPELGILFITNDTIENFQKLIDNDGAMRLVNGDMIIYYPELGNKLYAIIHQLSWKDAFKLIKTIKTDKYLFGN